MYFKERIFPTGKKLLSSSLNVDYLAACLLAVCCVGGTNMWLISAVHPAYASPPGPTHQLEEMNLLIYNQGMLNDVSIQINYVLENDSGHPSYSELLSTAVAAIVRDPNREQYWEVLNRSVTQELIQKYPEILYLSLRLEVSPRPTIPYTCISTVTHWRNGDVQENWSFIETNMLWEEEEIDIQVSYRYQESTNYTDFLDVRDRLITYMSGLNSYNLSVEQLEITLAHYLRKHYTDNFSELTVRISN